VNYPLAIMIRSTVNYPVAAITRTAIACLLAMLIRPTEYYSLDKITRIRFTVNLPVSKLTTIMGTRIYSRFAKLGNMTSTTSTAIQNSHNGAHHQLTFEDVLIAKFLYSCQSRDKDTSPESNASCFLNSATKINE
jgi:hypothetical protein